MKRHVRNVSLALLTLAMNRFPDQVQPAIQDLAINLVAMTQPNPPWLNYAGKGEYRLQTSCFYEHYHQKRSIQPTFVNGRIVILRD